MTTSSREYTLRFSDRQVVPLGRVALAVLFVLLSAIVLYFLRHLITPVVISIFLAYLLEPLVNALENRGMRRLWSTITVLAGFVALFAAGMVLLRERMAGELEVILANIQIDQPELLVDQAKEKLLASFPSQGRLINMFASVALHYVKSMFGPGVTGVTELLSAFGATIIIPFLIFFILNDSHALQKALVQQISNRYFEMSLSLIHKANRQLGRYIRGVLLDAAIVGVLVVIGLTLLDLRYAVFIGILAGMANLIPYLGPVVGGIPAIVISVIDNGNFSGVPSILLVFGVVKLIDDILIQPLVVSKSVELHPVTVIIAIYVGGHLGGILGMIVAVPLVAIIKESLSILYWGFTKYYIFRQPIFADLPVADSLAIISSLPTEPMHRAPMISVSEDTASAPETPPEPKAEAPVVPS